MALSGTLETFSLPDVLRLLSSTKKTGLLALDGDRGRGRVWVEDGTIVAATADRVIGDDVAGVAFELLRNTEASFEFDSGVPAPAEGEPHDVDEVLAEAESRLAEWRAIEAVVPSLDVWAHVVTEIDADRTVSPGQWRVLARVGTGTSGHTLADRLGEGEYDVCRQLRDLVEDGWVELGDAPSDAPAPVRTVDVDVDAAWDAPAAPTFVEPALDPDAVSSLGADLASFVAAGTVDAAVAVDFSEPTTDSDAVDDTDDTDEIEAGEVVSQDVEADDDDFLSQLSQLSPKAAAAVEATWSDDDDEPEATEDPEVDAEATTPAGDDIDQNLLLRFLSSAKG